MISADFLQPFSFNKKTLLVVFGLFLFSFCFRIIGIGEVGETWDEVAVVKNGAYYLRYVSEGDFGEESWSLNKEHPPIAKYLYGATMIFPEVFESIAQLDSEFPRGRRYTSARILSAFMGSLAVIFVFLLGRLLYDARVGVASAVIFSLLPHVVAHSRIAALETPLLLFTLSSVYFFLRRNFTIAGILFGLALGTKFNAAFVGVLFLLLTLLSSRPSGASGEIRTGSLDKLGMTELLQTFTVAGGVLLLSWPWLWHAPIDNLLLSVSQSADFTEPEFFLGKLQHVPFHYYFTYLISTTPVVVLGLFFLFLVRLVRELKDFRGWVVLVYCLVPFLASFYPLKQDGIRYVITFYPALAVGAAVGLVWLLGKLGETREGLGYLGSLGLVALILFFANFSVQPYQLDYYNEFFGGSKRVYEEKLFEIGWWGEGVREAVLFMNRNAKEGSSVNFLFIPRHVSPTLRDDLDLEQGEINQDYLVINTYKEWYDDFDYEPSNYREIYRVSAGKAPLVKVFLRTVDED